MQHGLYVTLLNYLIFFILSGKISAIPLLRQTIIVFLLCLRFCSMH